MSFTQNNNSLMGFSVHQPAVGAALQFFPPMGSKQLDEMINAYVPGTASILDKRTVVTCEFVQHSIATGELFKFFMVYPSHASDSFESPASLQDSAYGSFDTSPVMSESQWTNTSASSSSKVQSATKKSTAADFSHIPGMKIMTREGLDVTNSASRGCKTKEQRDHAHLMRIIKACEACRKKKIRCDPSHKKRSSHSHSPEPKASKKARKSSSVVPRATTQTPVSNQSTGFAPVPFAGSQGPPAEANNPAQWDVSSFDTYVPADEVDIFAEMESWDQFINYGDEPATVQQPDWDDFNVDQFSPTTTFTSSTSPSQPRTPAARGLGSNAFEYASASDFTASGGVDYAGAFASGESAPALPYLNPGGVESGTNYIDFNLYSPGSSCDGELGYSKDITVSAPSPRQEKSDRSGRIDRVDRVDHVEVDRPHDRSSEYRHATVSDSSLDDYSQDWRPVRLRQSQAPAESHHAATASNEAIPASRSLHDQVGSSPQVAANAVWYTGQAKPNNNRVPCDYQSQSLSSPQDPVMPSRPRGAREEEPEGMHTSVRTSGEVSGKSLSRMPRLTSRDIHSSIARNIAVESAHAFKEPRSAHLASTLNPMDQQSNVTRQRICVEQMERSSPRISVVASEQNTMCSGTRSTPEGRTSTMSQSHADLSKRSDATSPAMAGTNSTTSPADNRRSLRTHLDQTQLSKASTRTSQHRSVDTAAIIQEAPNDSRSINSSTTEKPGDIAIIGLNATAFSTTSMRTPSDLTLSAADLLWSILDNARQPQLESPFDTWLATGERRPSVPSRLPETLAFIGCLTVLTFASGATSLLYVAATIILAAVSMVLPQTLSSCADELEPSTQPLSLTRRFHIKAFHVDFGSEAHNAGKRLCRLRSSVGRILSAESSPLGSQKCSWQRLVL